MSTSGAPARSTSRGTLNASVPQRAPKTRGTVDPLHRNAYRPACPSVPQRAPAPAEHRAPCPPLSKGGTVTGTVTAGPGQGQDQEHQEDARE